MNKKKICPRCKKTKRTKCFTFNPVLKEELCLMCNKSVGTNKFYSPKSKSEIIGKFNMTNDEKKVLAKTRGWDRVNKDCKGLNTIKRRVKWDKIRKIKEANNNQKQKKELNKNFIEGLK